MCTGCLVSEGGAACHDGLLAFDLRLCNEPVTGVEPATSSLQVISRNSTAALSPAETRSTRDRTTVSGLSKLQPNCTATRPADAESPFSGAVSGWPSRGAVSGGHPGRQCVRLVAGHG